MQCHIISYMSTSLYTKRLVIFLCNCLKNDIIKVFEYLNAWYKQELALIKWGWRLKVGVE